LKTTVLLTALVVVCSAVRAADTITPLDVKLGQWETTTTTDSSGLPPIPPELLQRLTPEQRAKMEEMMKSRASAGPKTTTRKSCLKKEDLDKALSFGSDERCNRTIVTSSRSKQDIHLECAIGGGKQTGTIRVEALSSENVKGAMQMTMSGGDRTMNMNYSFNAKWIGPVCTKND